MMFLYKEFSMLNPLAWHSSVVMYKIVSSSLNVINLTISAHTQIILRIIKFLICSKLVPPRSFQSQEITTQSKII